MARYFLESSAFVKRYKPEMGTAFVNNLFTGEHDLFYLNLAILEVRKVFYRLWKHPQQGEAPITEAEFLGLEQRLADDEQEALRIDFTEEMIEKGMEVLNTIWLPSAFDLAQLAGYLVTKEVFPRLIFVCADENSNLVSAAKLFVPEASVLVPK